MDCMSNDSVVASENMRGGGGIQPASARPSRIRRLRWTSARWLLPGIQLGILQWRGILILTVNRMRSYFYDANRIDQKEISLFALHPVLRLVTVESRASLSKSQKISTMKE